mmetsp:Transcript_7737/g.11489  ORF Transcript_7737/g.11489 Transcript_7737/m.11489 type:complete len:235 (-) Transcript_7737:1988-2692(-)|eukprot:CAMPEP_0117423662 /NCGR_PEP_ID=MMETSP0758-20121206/4231_1 /TAXON_ID=63605 /ORGANISM="Percolomonas cosmopolitus, Strain AE-1 (ATCC 50343)" /LENGTH=234 /DNA_ID=CAMNT_0005206965 /DNA_START=421 /DNA_END=1125 /DNA_ORIENTATION=-
MTTVYVENIHPSLTQTHIKKLFNTIGKVKDVHFFMNDLGNPFVEGSVVSKQCAIVSFVVPEDAYMAVKTINWLKVKDVYRFRVGFYNHRYKSCKNPAIRDEEDFQKAPTNEELRQQELTKPTNHSDLPPLSPIDPSIPASSNLQICNVFDPHRDTIVPQWDKNLLRVMQIELEKFGDLAALDIIPSKGNVYVKFTEVAFAEEALLKFHGRFFNNRRLNARFVSNEDYQRFTTVS